MQKRTERIKPKMKRGKIVRKLAEPFLYVLLVAVFGLLTTIVNKDSNEEQVRDTEFVSNTQESELEAILYQEEEGVSL